MIYDRFQLESIRCIDEGHSLIVSAPTGSGKTVIAEYVIEKSFRENKGCIYTAPIKALSNQKYRDFKAKYGDSNVGIVTGDVSINPHAPIIIMTTEIFRNTLFDDTPRLESKSWIIYDEIHYIDDYERGTVWEESIMFFPKFLKILGLSATIPNVDELAGWIKDVTGQEIRVVTETQRPIPLTHHFQCHGKVLNSLQQLRKEGFLYHTRRSFNPKARPNKIAPLINYIKSNQGLPVIYFCFSRKRCQEIAFEAAHFDFMDIHETQSILSLFENLAKKYGLENEPSAQDMAYLIKRGIAYHHAGMLPTLKEVIEQLFTSRLIKFISTTETFALGINMPARTVIFDELRKFYGTHFSVLRTRDYYQMAGRAGRRGIDTHGFVYSRINPQDIHIEEIRRTVTGAPEPVKSQFNSSYATLLNLLKHYGKNLEQIYLKSFHCFQSKSQTHGYATEQIRRKISILESLGYITDHTLTPKGAFASRIFGYELPITEFYASGLLHELSDVELNILLAALVFEPRKRQIPPELPKPVRNIKRTAERIMSDIYRLEKQLQIAPKSKYLYFHLSQTVGAWSKQASFAEILPYTDTDEGEIIRYFRMLIQILRELEHIELQESPFKGKLRRCLDMINRGIVDAEKQLRID